MSWTNTKGFNFRSTVGYVTDGTDERMSEYSTAYPTSTTIDSDTFDRGWETSSSLGHVNRNSALDRRLAGVHYKFADSPDDFRIDLPSTGNYTVELALGDATDAQTQNFDILDGSTVLLAVSNVATAAEEFIDATGTIRTSAANWVSAQASATFAFATTICRLRMKVPSAGSTTIAHFSIRQAAAGGSQGAARYALSQMS